MNGIAWIKLSVNIFDDEKIRLIEVQKDGDTLLIIWVKILCLCGKLTCNGVLSLGEAPLNAEQLSVLLGKDLKTTEKALSTFVQMKMLGFEKNSYYIKNWEKYQNFEAADKAKAQTRERVKRYRERYNSVTGNVTCNVTERYSNGDVTHVEVEVEEEKRNKKKSSSSSREPDVVSETAISTTATADSGASDTLARYATENITCMTTANLLELLTFTDDMSEELIRYAIDQACGNGKPMYNYLKAILNRYAANGWKHIADVKANDRYGEKAKTEDGATWARSEIQFIDEKE